MNIYLLNATLNGKLLSEILCKRLNIKGMITLTHKAAENTNEYYDYTAFCNEHGIECIKLDSYTLKGESDKKIIMNLDIDLLIVASWQRLVPEWLINHCKIGIIGAHGSHEGIEKGRGRSPQNWAILTGKRSFSLSIFWIEPETDNGDIIDTVEFEYLSSDNILVSYIKINIYKAEMILKNIQNGRIARKEGTPQGKKGLFLPQRIKEDGQIDWNRDAIDIDNMVRALTKPYPGAYTVFNGKEYKIWISRPVVIDTDLYDDCENGTVISLLNESILVKCGKNMLLVDDCTQKEDLKQGIVFESADYYEQIKNIIKRHEKKCGTPLSTLVTNELKD